MLHVFETRNFPVLERLYLDKEVGNGPCASRETLFNILENCPNLKSVKLVGLDVSDPHADDIWCAFLGNMYKTFNVYIDIFSYFDWKNKFSPDSFEKYLKENDMATFYKYSKLNESYLDWKKQQPKYEWWW